MTTDTPRTDALMRPNGALATNILEHARQLERELNEAKAKVERIRAEKNACLEGNKYYGDKAVVLQDKINRAIDVLMEKIQ